MSVEISEPESPCDELPNGRPRNVPYPATVDRQRIVWGYVTALASFHLLLLVALVPGWFSWTGLLLLPIGNYVFCSLGIGAGFHRLLTHRSFQCPLWFEHMLAILGICCFQDSPARWVAIHRLHHQHSDDQPDPHTPQVNWFWGHMGWLLAENSLVNRISTYERYARDLLEDPFYLRLERHFLWIWLYAAHALVFYLIGTTIGWIATGSYWGGVHFGLMWVLWGVVYRTIYTWHVTWGVNSVCHMRGYRNYETRDTSHNSILLGLATNGDGFHNNHHAEPRSARHGHLWWELDITFLTIRLWQRLGLASELVLPKRRVRPR